MNCGPGPHPGLIVGRGLAARLRARPDPVRIGFFMSITGRDASFGEASLGGAEVAVDEVNGSGGVLGRQVELVVEDDRSLAGESATAAKKLISRDRVVALVGECSSARTLEAAAVAQASGVPLVTPASTSPRVTAGRRLRSSGCASSIRSRARSWRPSRAATWA